MVADRDCTSSAILDYVTLPYIVHSTCVTRETGGKRTRKQAGLRDVVIFVREDGGKTDNHPQFLPACPV